MEGSLWGQEGGGGSRGQAVRQERDVSGELSVVRIGWEDLPGAVGAGLS